jgi:hypothetical protein
MAEVRHEVKVHIITGAVTSARTSSLRQQAGWMSATSFGIIAGRRCPRRRKRAGNGLIDFGGRHKSGHFPTTASNTPRSWPGRNNLTNDIAVGWTPHQAADGSKMHGSYPRLRDQQETLEMPGVGGRDSNDIRQI